MFGSNISWDGISLCVMGFCGAFRNSGVDLTYRVKNPRGTVPGWCVEHRPQIKEEHSSNPATVHLVLRVALWLRDLDIRANDPQTDRASACTD